MNGRRKKKPKLQRSLADPHKGSSPLRSILESTSGLLERLQGGLGAVQSRDRNYIEEEIRPEFCESIELDEAFREGHDREHRWDYLLGHGPTSAVVALEPHSAKDDEVSQVIAKRRAALDQLRGHLKPSGRVAVWLWVASGRVQFADTEKARRTLDQNGIQFVGTKVLRRHLPTRK